MSSWLLLLLPLLGPSQASAPPAIEVLLIHGGRIHLGNAAGGEVEALLVEGGRIVAAGPEELLRQRLPAAGFDSLDLDGAVAVPGLQDAHGHLGRLGAALEQLDLGQAESFEALVAAVAEVAAGTPKGSWILGRGWDEASWGDSRLPHHAALSKAVPDHPVLLERAGGHALLANRRALAQAKLDGLLSVPPRVFGGRLLLDGEQRATGILLDNAMDLVRSLVPVPEAATRERRILAAQESLLSRGITCVHDMGVAPAAVELYEDLRRRGLLKLRIAAYLEGNAGLPAAVLAAHPRAADPLDLLSVPGVFFRLDGDLATRGAALLADYADAPGVRGHLLLTEERLTLLVHEAWQAGLQPALGAVGDRANRLALDVFLRMQQVDAGFAGVRPRIEHAQVVSPRDFPRFPEQGIVASLQPLGTSSRDGWIAARLGANRARGASAWRSLAPGWLPLAFGSGFPDKRADPWLGLHAARAWRGAEGLAADDSLGAEDLDGRGALAGFTRGAAFAVHQEDRRGQLLPGYWADLTVLDADPVLGSPEELVEARVLLTVINGRVVFRR
jgi:predicted amidohydrolase YtcJ